MDFKSALNKICQDFNKEILFERRVISILDDYGAFKDAPYYKLFYKTALSSGDLRKLIAINENKREREMYIFVSMTGLDEKRVKKFLSIIFDCHHGTSDKCKAKEIKDTILKKNHSSNVISNKEISPESLICTSSKVEFLGVKLGSRYVEFDKSLYQKGASKINSTTNNSVYIINGFIFDKDARITLYNIGDAPYIYRIGIEVLTENTSKDPIGKLLVRLLTLYEKKYGSYIMERHPYSTYTVYKWNLKDENISIRLAYNKVIITYHSDLFQKFIEHKRIEDAKKAAEAEKIRKKQEEEKQRLEKEAKQREEKRLLDLI